MKRVALGALVCLCGILAFAVEASLLGKEAGIATGPPTLEPVQPVLDLAESTSVSKSGSSALANSKENASGSEGTSKDSSASLMSLSSTSATTSGALSADKSFGTRFTSSGIGSFNYKIEIKKPAYHGLEPGIDFTYDSMVGIFSSGVNQNWLGFGWAFSGFSVIQRASPKRGVPAFNDSTDIYLRDGWEMESCTATRCRITFADSL